MSWNVNQATNAATAKSPPTDLWGHLPVHDSIDSQINTWRLGSFTCIARSLDSFQLWKCCCSQTHATRIKRRAIVVICALSVYPILWVFSDNFSPKHCRIRRSWFLEFNSRCFYELKWFRCVDCSLDFISWQVFGVIGVLVWRLFRCRMQIVVIISSRTRCSS